MNFWERLKKAVSVLFPMKQDEVLKKFNIPQQDVQKYDIYRNIVNGTAEWNDKCTPSLKLASGICNKITNKTFVEFDFSVFGERNTKPNLDSKGKLIYDKEKRYDYMYTDYSSFISSQLQTFTGKITETDKLINQLGRVLVKCAVKGNKISTVTIDPINYIPVKYNSSGDLLTVLSWSTFKRGKGTYTLYEYSNYDEINKTLIIEYLGYKQSEFGSPKQVDLKTIDEWVSLESIMTFKNIEQPFFIEIFCINGDPIYSIAIENIRECDKLYGELLNEFRTGASVIIASDLFFKKDRYGNPILPKGDERKYAIGSMENGSESYKHIAPTLREQSYLSGMNAIERIIEMNANLSHGTISEPSQQGYTATEINETKQDTLIIVGMKQAIWTNAINKLCKIYDELAQLYDLARPDKWELSISWGDGVKESDEEVFKRLQWLVQANVIDPVYLVAWQNGVTQDEAYLMMPETSEQIEVIDE